ncbi:MAG: hypothetical protein Q8R76_00600 [Candidatus Omnitrophota bacterium]|nr:hypothetical protein [Candidatus Omnitrophota bacterium]
MKSLLRISLIFVLGVVILLGGLYYWRNQLIEKLFVKFVAGKLQCEVTLTEAQLDLFAAKATFKNIKISNPEIFSRGTLTAIRELYLDWDFPALLEGRLHFFAVKLEVGTLRILRNKQALINILELNVFKEADGAEGEEAQPKRDINLQVDEFILILNHATYTDLSGIVPLQRSFNLHMKEIAFSNLTDLKILVKIVGWETLKAMGIEDMTNLNPNLRAQLEKIRPSASEGFVTKFVEKVKQIGEPGAVITDEATAVQEVLEKSKRAEGIEPS